MAEAFFEQISGGWNALSAGIKPDERIHPWTLELMKEVRIDLSQRTPKLLTSKMMEEADRIVAMDSDALKQIPPTYLSKTENWNMSSLLGRRKKEVRQIRDEIKNRVELLSKAVASSD
jgi:protein-tyrosine-phosphatase